MRYTDKAGCGYSEILVSYLYGEITPAESRAFEAHLGSCAICSEEFAEFNHIRDSVGVLRDQILTMAPSPADKTPAVIDRPLMVEPRKRSAVAALKEFIALSPVWLRGAAALAVTAFCALVVFSTLRLWHPAAVVVEKPEVVDHSQQQIEEVAKQRTDVPVAENRDLLSVNESTDGDRHAAGSPDKKPVAGRSRRLQQRQGSTPEPRFSRHNEIAGLGEARNQQILSDLGLTASRDDETKLSLSDLLGEPESNE